MKALRPEDYEKLLYLHSNRTMSISLFREKFFPDKSFFRAWQLLKLYGPQGKGYVFSEKKDRFSEAAFGLTRKAVLELREKRLALFTFLHPVSVNWNQVPHHHRMASLRISLETNPYFQDVFWVSDFEMRCGLSREVKWRFRTLPFEEREEYARKWKPRQYKRVPDGYFEALIEGKPVPFVVEYEHEPYSRDKVNRIIQGLEQEFGNSNKLIVSKNPENAARLNDKIWLAMEAAKRTTLKRELWMISDFEAVKTKPFEEAFKVIGEPEKRPAKTIVLEKNSHM